jgi:hypothetical protein
VSHWPRAGRGVRADKERAAAKAIHAAASALPLHAGLFFPSFSCSFNSLCSHFMQQTLIACHTGLGQLSALKFAQMTGRVVARPYICNNSAFIAASKK